MSTQLFGAVCGKRAFTCHKDARRMIVGMKRRGKWESKGEGTVYFCKPCQAFHVATVRKSKGYQANWGD